MAVAPGAHAGNVPVDKQSRHQSLHTSGTAAVLHVAGGAPARHRASVEGGWSVDRPRPGGARDRGCGRTCSQRCPDGRARPSADGRLAHGRGNPRQLTFMHPMADASSAADSRALVWDAERARTASPPPPESLPAAAAATSCAGRYSPNPAGACRHGGHTGAVVCCQQLPDGANQQAAPCVPGNHRGCTPRVRRASGRAAAAPHQAAAAVRNAGGTRTGVSGCAAAVAAAAAVVAVKSARWAARDGAH